MVMTYDQLSEQLRVLDNSSYKQATRNAILQSFRELETRAAETPHIKAELDRVIGEKVRLAALVSELEAELARLPVPPMPNVYPNPALTYPPGVRLWNSTTSYDTPGMHGDLTGDTQSD